MFTDIAGYTAMMEKYEQKALSILEKNRSLQKSLAKKHNGEFLKEMGDGTLLCFSSALDAVRCAMAIQESVKDEPDLNLRIGIHLGDIVFKEGDVFGDGVNVASRIEKLAGDGDICLSEEVYKSVRNQADVQASFLDEKQLKNVDGPVRIYRIGGQSEKSADRSREASSLAVMEKSIIVLPFVNISPHPDQEYFSDGLTEEIITDLSHIHDLLVISRNTAMTYKGTKKKTGVIAREANVRYVLEGSVRKAGNHLRITAQLIDAEKDVHLWAEKYSGTLDDVFDIQETVSRAIAEALKLTLSPEENRRISERPIENVPAYELYLKANAEMFKFTEQGITRAIGYLQNALSIIGDNALLYSGLAFAYFNLVNIGVKQEEYLVKAEEYVKNALGMDPEFPKAHVVLGWIYCLGELPRSIYHLKKALEITPDDSMALGALAIDYLGVGKIPAAARISERLLKVDPLDYPPNYARGAVYFYDGQYDKALKAWEKLYTMYPESAYSKWSYALILTYNKQYEEAFSIIDQSAKTDPDNVLTKLGILLKYGVQGEKEKAVQEMTPDFKKTCRRTYTFAHHLAGVFALLDEKEEALNWLESAVNRGFINYPLLARHDPLLENIRGEARFRKLMERVKHEWENVEV